MVFLAGAEGQSPSRVDIAGAATYLGVSQRWIRRAVFERRLAHSKLGAKIVFDTRDLDAYLEANRREAK